MAAVERGLQRCGVGGEAVRLVVHATTVATNALIEGKTASLGMLTTRGFRDILEIGREIRARLYDVHLTKPRPLVPRRWSFGIRERLDAEGRVLEPLDVEAVRQAVRQCKAAARSHGLLFLHSYINPEHERLAAAIVREEYPEAFLPFRQRSVQSFGNISGPVPPQSTPPSCRWCRAISMPWNHSCRRGILPRRFM